METGSILFLTLVLSLIIGVIGRVILKKGHRDQKAEYPKIWKEFQNLIEDNSFIKTKEILDLGNQLVFNKYIPTEHLVIIQEYAKEMEFRYPEFEELRLKAYDKWIYHTQGHGHGF